MDYAAWLNDEDYAYGTLYLEITTIKQLVKYLIEVKELPATASFKVPMQKGCDRTSE